MVQINQRHITLLLCACAALVEGFDTQAMGVAAPMLIQQFGLQPQESGWLFALGTLGQAIGAMTGGWLADRLGRKQALITSLLLFGVCSGATVIVQDLSALYIVRFVTGLGLGGALPNFITIASEAAPPEKRLRTGALIMAGLPIGGAVAGVIAVGGSIGWGWRSIFIIGAMAPMLLAVVMVAFLRELRATDQDNAGNKMRGLHQSSLLSVLFGFSQASTTLFLWISFFFIQLILLLMLNWLPTLLVGSGYSAVEASWCAVVFGIAGGIGGILFGHLQSGKRRAMWVAFSYLGISIALAAVGFANGGVWIVLLACATAGLFMIGAQMAIFSLAPLYYPRVVRATGVGAAVAVGRMGSVVGPLFAGMLLSRGGDTASVLLGIEPFVVLGGAGALALCWRKQYRD